MSKKIVLWCVAVLSCLFLCVHSGLTVFADAVAVILEKYATDDEIVLYVDNVDYSGVESATYQIGLNTCSVNSIMPVRETEETVRTLILWDVSIDLMERYGDRVKDLLTDMVASRGANEEFAIAVMDREPCWICDYSGDYVTLKQAITDVSGEDRDVYLIENLRSAVEALNQTGDCGFKRIIVISDGSGASGDSYITDDLKAVLERTPYPIYSIGMQGQNSEQMQTLFSFSHMTGADFFYLEDIQDDMVILEALNEDYDILQVRVEVPAELRDGTKQNSQLSLRTSEETIAIQAQVTLPYAVRSDADICSENTAEVMDDEAGIVSEVSVSGQGTETGGGSSFLGMQSGAVVLMIGIVLVLVIVIVYLLTDRNKKKPEETGSDYSQLDHELRNKIRDNSGNEKTFLLTGRKILLTDISDPGNRYQCNMTGSVVIIGRNSACGIVIPQDKSVSGRHCEISIRDNQFYIRDLGSANGTKLNGQSLSSSPASVHTGDTITIGTAEYRLTL